MHTGDLVIAEPETERIVKDVEDAFRLLPPATSEFDHFHPSSYLIENPAIIKALPGYAESLNRFEKLFRHLNKLIV